MSRECGGLGKGYQESAGDQVRDIKRVRETR